MTGEILVVTFYFTSNFRFGGYYIENKCKSLFFNLLKALFSTIFYLSGNCCCFCTKVSLSNFKRGYREVCLSEYLCTYREIGERSNQIKCSARSCPFACKSSTKDFNIRISWESERKDSDSSFPEIPEFTDKEILGEPFLVSWILC